VLGLEAAQHGGDALGEGFGLVGHAGHEGGVLGGECRVPRREAEPGHGLVGTCRGWAGGNRLSGRATDAERRIGRSERGKSRGGAQRPRLVGAGLHWGRVVKRAGGSGSPGE
jgi:hypothetical protein